MECPRCHNQDIQYFSKVNNHYYCRKCIQFDRVFVDVTHQIKQRIYQNDKKVTYKLPFDLSSQQKEISSRLLENYQNGINSYVFAVCGSGKTEIVFETICYALNQGHRVCFCIPRKELVKELYQRISESFHDVTIGLLYGGCHQNPHAQMIVCTMHQLAQFENDVGFDLMIGDEVDAFPFYGNEVLQKLFHHCTFGSFIQLSATFVDRDIQNGELLIMNRRYHHYDLPKPKLILCPSLLQKWLILLILKTQKKRWLIFVPTISLVEDISFFLKKRNIAAEGISSHSHHVNNLLSKLQKHDRYTLVTTTILERGITLDNIHVIVLYGDHPLFDRRTLIQIAGRVGRKPEHPFGNIYILSSSRSYNIKQCIRTIQKLNQMSA